MNKADIEKLVQDVVGSKFGVSSNERGGVAGYPGARSVSKGLTSANVGSGSAEKREYIVAANWKMNMTAKETKKFLEAMKGLEIPSHLRAIIFPPYPYLYEFRDSLRYEKIAYGSQDVAKEEKGAFTGEVSATMVADMGCTYTLTGHSERRTYYAETPEIVAKKSAAALAHNVTPMICIGETLDERQSNRYKEVLKVQLDAIKDELGARITDTVIAYEPVWAIGTGVIPTDAQIAETMKYIYDLIASYPGVNGNVPKILYGGSVNEKNVKEIAAIDHVDGFLIGGAGLKAESYTNIIKSVS